MFEKLFRNFLYYPLRLPEDAPLPRAAKDAEEVWIESDLLDRIHGLYWPAHGGRPTILFFHGNAQSVFEWALVRQELALLDSGLLLIDYPGYGKSTGTPKEEGLFSAGKASFNWLVERAGVKPERVLLFGKSLGGPVAARTASGRPVLGLVLESTFRSLPHVIHRLVPILPSKAVLKSEIYNTKESLEQVSCPVLVIHGTRDELIPVQEGVALYEAAGGDKELFLVEGAGHNDVSLVAEDEYQKRLRAWLDRISG
ncbi:MAG: alpha/beta hydrolase [Deltaproteobacteria bacterium]|nr:alpha/beta hydrolase [Deltaproteobacteria bacterium]